MERNNEALSKLRKHAPPPPNTWDVDDDVRAPLLCVIPPARAQACMVVSFSSLPNPALL